MAEPKQRCGSCKKTASRLIFFVPNWPHGAKAGTAGLCEKCFGLAKKAAAKAVSPTDKAKGA